MRAWQKDLVVVAIVVVIAAALLERCGLYLPGRAPTSAEATHEQR